MLFADIVVLTVYEIYQYAKNTSIGCNKNESH